MSPEEALRRVVRALERTGDDHPSAFGARLDVSQGLGLLTGPNDNGIFFLPNPGEREERFGVSRLGARDAMVEDWTVYAQYIDALESNLQLPETPVSGDNLDPRAPLAIEIEYGVGAVAHTILAPVPAYGVAVHVIGTYAKVSLRRWRTIIGEAGEVAEVNCMVSITPGVARMSRQSFAPFDLPNLPLRIPIPAFAVGTGHGFNAGALTYRDAAGNILVTTSQAANGGVPDLAFDVSADAATTATEFEVFR